MHVRSRFHSVAAIALSGLALPGNACAEVAGGPPEAGAVQIKPIIDARLRYETVDQGALDADAVTFRLRAGAEASIGHVSILAEGEANGALVNDYSAFPFAIVDKQRRPQFSIVPDPQNVEINRLQIQYKSRKATLTAGRQRINLDDQRWVGSVGWRQNEQTFDAIRAEASLGPVALDLTYALSQRTIFGSDAGPRAGIDGDFVFAGVGAKLGPVQAKAFSYLIDYDEAFALANSSQTYGVYATTAIPTRLTKLSIRGSYARQSDYGRSPFNYAADYWSFEAAAKLSGFAVTGGWEQLGSDNGRAVQTPLATLHKFNGWADQFLTTPADGLEDAYVGVSRAFSGIKALPGLNANIAFHQFDSATGNIEYGIEWNASAGFKIGKLGVLVKYADYRAVGFSLDTRKLWLQTEYSF